MQSRLGSFTESLLNVGIGFGISLLAQMTFLPMLGVAIDHAQNLEFALIMTAVSIARSYGVRRLFETLHIRRPLSPFMQAVIAERFRQLEIEGFDNRHDEKHVRGELALAGAAYLKGAGMLRVAPEWWPWGDDWWKPSDFRRDLVKGCALGIAEGDRLERMRPNSRTRASVTGGGVKAEWPKGTHP